MVSIQIQISHTWVVSAENMYVQIFNVIIGFNMNICIQMRSNKPIIGLVVLNT